MTVDPLRIPLRSYPLDVSPRDLMRDVSPGAIPDVIIVFGGWGSRQGGELLPRNPAIPTGTSKLVARLSQIDPAPLHTIVLEAYEGELMRAKGVQRAIQLLRDNFHPLGRWIIYGYSAGGVSAQFLCWAVWNEMRYYDVSSKTFLTMMAADSKRVCGFPRVDLLITVDSATGPFSGMQYRGVPPCVRKNLNLFQPFKAEHPGSSGPTGAESHGGPAFAVDRTATEIENQNLGTRYVQNPGEAHGHIDDDTIEDVVDEIQSTLGRSAPVPLRVGVGRTA